MHRGYHGLAIPTWERTVRVVAGWITTLVLGRDTVGLRNLEDPRAGFVDAAAGLAAPWPAVRRLPTRQRV